MPCEIELQGIVGDNNERLNWQRSVLSSRGNTRRDKDTNKLAKIAADMQQLTRNGESVNLPVFDYYGTGRLWQERKKTTKLLSRSSKFDAYQDSIERISTSNTFISWMKTRTLAELQSKIKDEALVLVKAAVSAFLERDETIEYSVSLDSIVLEKHLPTGISTNEWQQLSDGYRNIIAMAADLAYRCYTLNSHLGPYTLEKSKGVVLIDEIDIHLHPNWQKSVVNSFKIAFPNIQFITTTHSPFIIQSLKNDELIDLEGKNLTGDYFRQSIEDIAEAEMRVKNPQRSEKFLKMKEVADKYYSLIIKGQDSNDQNEVISIKKDLDRLLLPFYDDPGYVSFLQSFKPQLDQNETNRKR